MRRRAICSTAGRSSLARDADASFRGWIDESAEAILTVEFEGRGATTRSPPRLHQVRETAARTGMLVSEPFGNGRSSGMRSPAGAAPAGRAVAHAVSRPGAADLDRRRRGRAAASSSPRCLQRLQGLLQQQNVTWTLDACAGDGRLRLRPFLDLADPGDRAKLEPLAAGVYDIVLEAGGTIGSSQACGLARTQFLRKQYGELSQVFREIKDAFDPLGQFNPGKVIGDDPHLMLRNLKPWPAPHPKPAAAIEPSTPISWGSGEIRAELAAAALGREPELIAHLTPGEQRPLRGRRASFSPPCGGRAFR